MDDMEIRVYLEEADVKKDFFDCKENNLKCPSCGQELKQDYYDCIMFECHNPKCKHYYDSCIGREELWQELIRTRKALEIAINALKFYSDKPGNWLYGEFQGDYNETPSEIADEALNKIKTTLEQKDVK